MATFLRVLRLLAGLIFAVQVAGLVPAITWLQSPASVTGAMQAQLIFKTLAAIVSGALFHWLGKLAKKDKKQEVRHFEGHAPVRYSQWSGPFAALIVILVLVVIWQMFAASGFGSGKQVVSPNPFDVFDNSDNGQISRSDVNEPREVYEKRVHLLMRLRQSGDIPTVTTRLWHDRDLQLGAWPIDQVERIEMMQTWWVEHDDLWVHVTNQAQYEIHVLDIEFSTGSCLHRQAVKYSRHRLVLNHPVLPGNQALVKASAYPVMKVNDGCLIISGILG